jgi:predicted amidohydrolase
MSEVACLQVGSLGAGPAQRRETAARLVEQAGGADLVVLPELWTVGYFAFDEYEAAAEPLDGPTLGALSTAARNAGAYVVLGSFVERSPHGLHNTAAILDPSGTLLGSYRKIHVFGYGSREAELIEGGDEPLVVDTELGRLGLALCYDLRFPELFRALLDRDAELFVIPAAWPAARLSHWQTLLRARAIESLAYVVACNGAGTPDGTLLAGNSAIVDPWGDLVAAAGAGETTLRGAIEVGTVTSARAEFPALGDRRLEVTR